MSREIRVTGVDSEANRGRDLDLYITRKTRSLGPRIPRETLVWFLDLKWWLKSLARGRVKEISES